jgi:hypothetical protein
MSKRGRPVYRPPQSIPQTCTTCMCQALPHPQKYNLCESYSISQSIFTTSPPPPSPISNIPDILDIPHQITPFLHQSTSLIPSHTSHTKCPHYPLVYLIYTISHYTAILKSTPRNSSRIIRFQPTPFIRLVYKQMRTCYPLHVPLFQSILFIVHQ